jgi:hypothetical protein
MNPSRHTGYARHRFPAEVIIHAVPRFTAPMLTLAVCSSCQAHPELCYAAYGDHVSGSCPDSLDAVADVSTLSSAPHSAQIPIEGAAISCLVPHASQPQSAGINVSASPSVVVLSASLVCTIRSNMVFLFDASSEKAHVAQSCSENRFPYCVRQCDGCNQHSLPWLSSEFVCIFRKLPDPSPGANGQAERCWTTGSGLALSRISDEDRKRTISPEDLTQPGC